MSRIKLQDLESFHAVVTAGSFQAAGRALKRTHPSVFAAVARLEESLGLRLLDRSGYRVALTEAGHLFHTRARLALGELDELVTYADQLASGDEPVLRIVIGDLAPRPPILRLLGTFFADHSRTRLHLAYEAVGGPLERLLDGEADLVIHRADPSDTRLERIDLHDVTMVPVVARGFLPFAITRAITPEQMRPFTQCVIRDTAQRSASESHFLVEGAHQCSTPDQSMKKELIVHGLAWGHLPSWLIEKELRDGTLLSIAGAHLPGRTEKLAAVRRRRRSHGPVAAALVESAGRGPGWISLSTHSLYRFGQTACIPQERHARWSVCHSSRLHHTSARASDARWRSKTKRRPRATESGFGGFASASGFRSAKWPPSSR